MSLPRAFILALVPCVTLEFWRRYREEQWKKWEKRVEAINDDDFDDGEVTGGIHVRETLMSMYELDERQGVRKAGEDSADRISWSHCGINDEAMKLIELPLRYNQRVTSISLQVRTLEPFCRPAFSEIRPS